MVSEFIGRRILVYINDQIPARGSITLVLAEERRTISVNWNDKIIDSLSRADIIFPVSLTFRSSIIDPDLSFWDIGIAPYEQIEVSAPDRVSSTAPGFRTSDSSHLPKLLTTADRPTPSGVQSPRFQHLAIKRQLHAHPEDRRDRMWRDQPPAEPELHQHT
jgi:hypothetical protein